jgi:hypothetical protein
LSIVDASICPININ